MKVVKPIFSLKMSNEEFEYNAKKIADKLNMANDLDEYENFKSNIKKGKVTIKI